jgi:BRCA1 C Terminus (BRCT) domain
MATAAKYTWPELYLILDLYSAWTRVLVRWLYLEGMSCVPTATVSFDSDAAAKKAAGSWENRVDRGNWTVQGVGSDAVAIHNSGFDLEEAQDYTSGIEALGDDAGRPCRLCSVNFVDLYELSDSQQSKVWKILGLDPEEDEDEMQAPLVLALLRRWKDFPPSFPIGKFEVSGTLAKRGLSDIRVVSYDGDRELDVTDVMKRALRDSLDFMKEHGIKEPTPWFSNDEISWKAPNAGVAKTIADTIQTCQGSANAKGDRVKGRPGEIWSVLTWYKFARWGGIFRDYGAARKDPRIPELSGPAPKGGSFSGEVVCFTGKLEAMERDEAEGLVEANGGRSAGRVTAEVTLVVATRSASSKRAKAEKLGLPIIDEAEFLRRIGR